MEILSAKAGLSNTRVKGLRVEERESVFQILQRLQKVKTMSRRSASL